MTNNEYYLQHHGILGQKWGVRRYQNPDGSLTNAGKKRYSIGETISNKIRDIKYGKTYNVDNAKNVQTAFGKTRYTNLDGTLNEKGKKLASSFAQDEIDRNNKYYNKLIKKYNEASEVYKDEDKKKSEAFKKMAKSAEESRDSTNENLKRMNLNQILETQTQRNQRKIGIIGAVAGLIGAGGLVTAAAKTDARQKLFQAIDNFDPNTPIQKLEAWANSEKGSKAMKYVDATLRSYSDVRAYTLGTMIDQSMNRLDKMGIPQRVGNTLGSAVKEFSNSSGFNNVKASASVSARQAGAVASAATKELIDYYKKNSEGGR